MLAKYRIILASLVCMAAVYAPASHALVNWWTTSNHCTVATGGTCGGEFASSRTFESMTGELVTTTAWANTANINAGSNNRLATGDIAQYGGGLGVRNADYNTNPGDPGEGIAPEHAMDNDGRFDMILFDFHGLQIALEEVYVGWYSGDADISVLAYTGNGPLDLGNRQVDGTSEDLTANGWQIVGNYDVDSNADNSGNNAFIQPDNDDNDLNDLNGKEIVSSSYWLIGAYNPVFASGGCDPVYNFCNGPDTYADFFKIKDLAGSIVTPVPPNNVPEPGSLLLLATALVITPRLRRNRAAA